jgi:hypothetical protein
LGRPDHARETERPCVQRAHKHTRRVRPAERLRKRKRERAALLAALVNPALLGVRRRGGHVLKEQRADARELCRAATRRTQLCRRRAGRRHLLDDLIYVLNSSEGMTSRTRAPTQRGPVTPSRTLSRTACACSPNAAENAATRAGSRRWPWRPRRAPAGASARCCSRPSPRRTCRMLHPRRLGAQSVGGSLCPWGCRCRT